MLEDRVTSINEEMNNETWAVYKEKQLTGGATEGSILSLLSFYTFEKSESYYVES